MSTPGSSGPISEEEVYHDHSFRISSWESDISVSVIFKSLSVNMVSANHVEDVEEDTNESEEMNLSDTDL